MIAPVARPAVLVIGAAGTLGTAVCRELAERGNTVHAADFLDCASLVAGLTGAGHWSASIDVTDSASVEQLVGRSWADAELQSVVYAAGTNYTGPVATTSWPDYDRVMDVNVRGAFQVGKALGARLLAQPRPLSTVFLSSVAGLAGEAGGSVYCASKFALIGFVQSFASEIAKHGGRANAVCPGNVDSVMLRELAEQVAVREGTTAAELLVAWANSTAFNRLIEPAEVARACVWLASSDSSGISGQTIVVDGPPPAA